MVALNTIHQILTTRLLRVVLVVEVAGAAPPVIAPVDPEQVAKVIRVEITHLTVATVQAVVVQMPQATTQLHQVLEQAELVRVHSSWELRSLVVVAVPIADQVTTP